MHFSKNSVFHWSVSLCVERVPTKADYIFDRNRLKTKQFILFFLNKKNLMIKSKLGPTNLLSKLKSPKMKCIFKISSKDLTAGCILFINSKE